METQGRKYAVGAGFSEHLVRSQTHEVNRHTTSQGCRAGEAMAGRVLVVADEVDLRDALTDRLTRVGFNVVTATNGAAGMEILRLWQINGVLLDMELPDREGLTMLQQLQLLRARIPVIVMSTSEHKKELEAGLQTGAQDYILKPLNLELLTHKCQRLFA